MKSTRLSHLGRERGASEERKEAYKSYGDGAPQLATMLSTKNVVKAPGFARRLVGVVRKTGGYTIIEVMIFLAVSGLMFVVAAAFISGKQANSEFVQGVNDANTQIQNVINDVANGYYSSMSNFTCSPNASGPTFTSVSGTTQGSNQGCVFLGKVIQFGAKNTSKSGYNVYTIAGNQYADGSDGSGGAQLSDSLAQAMPKAVYNNSSSPPVDLTSKNTLEWGITVSKMVYMDSSDNPQPLSAVGFFGGFGAGNDLLASGAQAVNMVAITDTSLDQDEPTTVTNINTYMPTATENNKSSVILCLKGPHGRLGSVTIGTYGARLSTDMEIGNKLAGVCKS